MIRWQPEYSVKIEVLDRQHKEIFKLYEELCLGLERKRQMDVSFAIIKLDVYALYHFASEEQLLEKFGYPGLEEQKKEHEAFTEQVKLFKERYGAGDRKLLGEMKEWLEHWITSHIRELDSRYGAFLNQKGVH